MEKKYSGRLMVRVTVNGCGLPLDGARIYIKGIEYTVPQDSDGFSEIIRLFTEEIKGICKYFDICAEYEGFEPLICRNIPVSSGYLTVWNMPLKVKVKESQKNSK